MKKQLLRAPKYVGTVAVVAFGLFLIGYSILAGGAFPNIEAAISGWVKPAAEPSLPLSDIPKAVDEVRNYVLFTHVAFGEHDVVTGTEYGSTASRKIAKQWCYLGGKARPGGSVLRLSLARVSKDNKKTTTQFTPEALGLFDLNDKTARSLVNTHCRFR